MNIKKSLGALAVTVSMLLGLTSCITKQDLSAADYRTDTEGLAFTRYAEAAFEPAAPREEFQSLLTGYEKAKDTCMVKAVSYGEWIWLDFKALWDTGYDEKGGLIIFRIR